MNHKPKKVSPPKLYQDPAGNLYARFYNPAKRPKQKNVYIGYKSTKRLSNPLQEAPAYIINRFQTEYSVPYLQGLFDPWESLDESSSQDFLFSDAITRYVERPGISPETRRTDLQTLKELGASYTDRQLLSEVTPDDLKNFIYRDHLSAAYQRSLFTRLRAAFNWWVKENLLDETQNPLKRVTPPKGQVDLKHHLEPQDVVRLIQQIQEDFDAYQSTNYACGGVHDEVILWLKDPFLLGVSTGLRINELRRLRVGHVQAARGVLYVRNTAEGRTKSRRERIVPLCEMSEGVVDRNSTGKSKDDYLFTGAKGGPINTNRLSNGIKSRLVRLGISDVNFHAATRHTFASWLVMLGWDIGFVADVLGHGSTRVTDQYRHLKVTMLGRNVEQRYTAFAEEVQALGFFGPPYARPNSRIV